MNFIKDLFFALYPKRLPNDRAVILMYHSVSDWNHFTTVSLSNFKRHLAYLAQRKIPVISLSELVRRLKARESLGGSVVITFDDGSRDNLTSALPALKKYGFPATVFVTTDWTGTTDEGLEYLSREEVRVLQSSSLVDIGSHTKSHPRLTALSSEVAEEEMRGAKRLLEEWLGKPCPLFAYPYGKYDERILSLTQRVGLEVAVTVKEGTVFPGAQILELPRVSIDRSTTFVQFKGKLSTTVDVWEALKIWR